MPVEKGKVLTAIEAKLKGKSLSKNFKENIATKWAEKIDTDENIDSYIEDREDILLEASSEADRRATEAAQKAKGEQKKDDGAPPADPATPPAKTPGTEPKSEIDELKELVKSLAGTVTTMQQQRTQETITERFRKDERLKGVPEFMFKGRIPAKEEDFETAVTELAADYTDFAKQNKLAAFGNDTPPAGKGGAAGKVDKDLLAFAAKKNESVKSKS